MSVPPSSSVPSVSLSRRSRWRALLRQRCPDCGRGRIFRSLFQVHDACPVCGLCFTPEPGYFTGAMYLSYPLGMAVLALFTLVGWYLLPTWRPENLVLLSLIPYLPVVPVIYRYSRVCWIYFDRWGSGHL